MSKQERNLEKTRSICKDYFKSEQWTEYLKLMEERPAAFQDSEQLQIITDPETVTEFMERTGRIIGVLYQSPFSILVVDLVKGTDGDVFAYERLLPALAEGAVITVPRCGESFILVKQFRHAIRKTQLSFPRGFGEKNINVADNTIKELKEEIGAGVTASRWLGVVTADSGILGNEVDVVEATIEPAEFKYGHEGITEVCLYTENEIDELIAGRKITDGYTLAAWVLYKSSKE